MSGARIFADTNAVLHLLHGNKTAEAIFDGRDVTVSFITEIELLSYPRLTKSEQSAIERFLDLAVIMDVNAEVKEQTILIRRSQKLKLPDALIAASASYLNLPLVTSDKSFASVKSLWLHLYQP